MADVRYPIDFEEGALKRTYSDRTVDEDWRAWCSKHVSPRGRDVVDIGCGGGIYSRGFAELGAKSVIGIDSSEQYVEEAREGAISLPNTTFAVGTADKTELPDACADIVFHRAVIHHLSKEVQMLGAAEMLRILRSAGICLVQDRTMEDVESTRSEYWIRSTLFNEFPRLLEIERGRRPSIEGYSDIITGAGFRSVEVLRYAETRKVYSSFDDLEAEIMARKGKSILFELSDAELNTYCVALAAKTDPASPVVEKDPWTIWLAKK